MSLSPRYRASNGVRARQRIDFRCSQFSIKPQTEEDRLDAREKHRVPRRLALPYNHDSALIDRIAHLSDRVEEIYFAASPAVAASGRHRIDAVDPNTFVADVRQLLEQLRPLQIKSNLLVNPSCLGDGYHDVTPILRHLSQMQELGVTMVTLTDLNLAIEVRRRLPELAISASTTALVDSAVKAMQWWNFCGVDDICPDRDVNKRPTVLGAIRRAAPSARMRLLVNDHCLPNCALRLQCMNSIAHNAASWRQTYLKLCLQMKREQPWVIYSNSMIVPANIRFFEERQLADVFKIQGRQAATDYIVALAEHYLGNSRVYDPLAPDSARAEEPEGVFQTICNCSRNCDSCNLDRARDRGFQSWCHYTFSRAPDVEGCARGQPRSRSVTTSIAKK